MTLIMGIVYAVIGSVAFYCLHKERKHMKDSDVFSLEFLISSCLFWSGMLVAKWWCG